MDLVELAADPTNFLTAGVGVLTFAEIEPLADINEGRHGGIARAERASDDRAEMRSGHGLRRHVAGVPVILMPRVEDVAEIGDDMRADERRPNATSAYPRVLGRYVRERKAITLAQAINKMSALPASRIHLKDRGQLAPRMAAVELAPTVRVFRPSRRMNTMFSVICSFTTIAFALEGEAHAMPWFCSVVRQTAFG